MHVPMASKCCSPWMTFLMCRRGNLSNLDSAVSRQSADSGPRGYLLVTRQCSEPIVSRIVRAEQAGQQGSRAHTCSPPMGLVCGRLLPGKATFL